MLISVRRYTAIAAAVILVAGCGGKGEQPTWFRISGEAGIGPVLSAKDVARSSVRATIDPGSGGPVVYLRLTNAGERKFARLTAKLAHRGASVHRPFHVVITVDDRVIDRPWIDYRHFPNGLSAQSGIQLNRGSLAGAKTLARRLRAD